VTFETSVADVIEAIGQDMMERGIVDDSSKANNRVWSAAKIMEFIVGIVNVQGARGLVDAHDPYVLRLRALMPAGLPAPYSNYAVTIVLVDQSDRTIVITGDVLDAAPDSITDTASLVSLAGTGVIVCDSDTTIGGVSVANGSTQNVFNGTMQNMEIVANLANLWGDINITVSVDDADTQTATVTL